jgi:hypothetical protein
LGAVKNEARGGEFFIYASQSEDGRDNPLPYKAKIAIMRTMFPGVASEIQLDTSVVTFFDAAKNLSKKGYKNLRMVAGSDRVGKFKELLDKYNGDLYNFYSIDVVSAGERDPDQDGVAGMSASKMRQAVRDDNYSAFVAGLPKSYKDKQALFDLLKTKLS